MNGKDILNGLTYVDEKYINETEFKKPIKIQKPIWKKAISIAACLTFVAVLAISALQNPQKPENNFASADSPQKNYSISIPAMELPQKANNAAPDMIGFVVYNGKIYTQAEYLRCDNQAKQKYIGDFLGTASGTIDEFSQKSEYCKEFASSVSGDVYTVNGYDKDFRICIPQIYCDSHFIAFFENLNGIGLSVGEDLYGKKRLNLKGNYNKVVYQPYEDWNNGNQVFKEYTNITEDEWNKFIDDLYQSPFVDLSKESTDICSKGLKQAHIYFKMNDGTTISVILLENGYVGYENMRGSYFVKVKDNIFKKVLNESVN